MRDDNRTELAAIPIVVALSGVLFAIMLLAELVFATRPEGAANWLAQDVVESARTRYDVPVTHVVVGEG
jgi:hypothetical protein